MFKDDLLVKRVENDKAVLSVYYDILSENPREDRDNFGTFYTWQRHYRSPDEHHFQKPRDFLLDLASEYVTNADRLHDKSNDALLRLLEKHVVILPVYVYEHGGISYQTSRPSCPWDSGQVGWIFVTKDKIRKEFGIRAVTKKHRKRAEDILRSEVEVYSNYADGQVFCFVLEEKVVICQDGECEGVCTCGSEDTVTEYKELQRESGFYGFDFKTNGMLDALDPAHRELASSL